MNRTLVGFALAVTVAAAPSAQSVHPRDRVRAEPDAKVVRRMTSVVLERYRRQIIREAHYHFGLMPTGVFFAQIYQESRFGETARSPAGARGLAQFMAGTAGAMQRNYGSQLTEFCRERGGCPNNPQWAIRAMMLLDKENYRARRFATGDERLGFMLADYNGGLTWVNTEREYCAQTKSCDPNGYFTGVALACGKVIAGPRRAVAHCKENTAYPERILYDLRPVYHRWLAGQ